MSSLCTFLANNLLEDLWIVGVVDADVGQADIGPPTTISSSVVQAPIIGLHKVTANLSFFIGDTSPSSVSDKLVNLATRLKKSVMDTTDIGIVNTDGWLAEFNAIRHKQLLLDEIRPDMVMFLGRFEETIDPSLDAGKFTSISFPCLSFTYNYDE